MNSLYLRGVSPMYANFSRRNTAVSEPLTTKPLEKSGGFPSDAPSQKR